MEKGQGMPIEPAGNSLSVSEQARKAVGQRSGGDGLPASLKRVNRTPKLRGPPVPIYYDLSLIDDFDAFYL